MGLRGVGSFAVLLMIGPAAFPHVLPAGDRPQFRGPDGQGIAQSTEPPLSWSETRDVTWKKELSGLGWSSPVIGEGKLWLTVAADEGRSLRAVALDPESGETLHDIELFHFDDPPKINNKNSYATPTPWIEDGRVYVHFRDTGHRGAYDRR